MNQLAQQPAFEYVIKVLNGPDKGAEYKLMSQKVSLGRDADNDIVIQKDPKCSRKHAVINFDDKGIKIFDVTQKNKISVDGSKGKMRELKDKSVIIIGSTKLQFRIQSPNQGLTPVKESNNQINKEFNHNVSAPKPRADKKRINIILISIVLLVLAFAISKKSSDKNKNKGLRTSEQINANIQAEQAQLQKFKEEKRQKGKYSIQYRKAQTHYIKGFRDYQKGQYERALQAFDSCLSMFPAHVLCNKYQKLSQKKLHELIQYHMVLGRQHKEQNQYQSCVASFQNVLFMVHDKSSKIYREAKAQRDTCKTFLEDRF